MWYQFLNIFFFVFHTAFTLFNAVGWAFRKTRRLHLVTLLLIVFSWFILGIWFGWGYCVCTEWHWQVKLRLQLNCKMAICKLFFSIVVMNGGVVKRQTPFIEHYLQTA
jgi:hypothetical protein